GGGVWGGVGGGGGGGGGGGTGGARGQPPAAGRSDRNTGPCPPITRIATKKSSPTAASPIVPPMLGCWRRTWISPARSSVRAWGSRSTSQVASSRYTTTTTSSLSDSVIVAPWVCRHGNGLRSAAVM